MSNIEELVKITCGLVEAEESEAEKMRVFLSVAKQKILNRLYPFKSQATVLPAKYEMLQCEIAAYLYNKQGAEGQTGHSENGVSRSYENGDVPESLMRQITPFGKVF